MKQKLLLTILFAMITVLPMMVIGANGDQASLVQTIDTSQWSPPSPDSAGIVYLDFSGTFLICDSEVNEMSIFTGDNLFEMTLDGDLIDTMTTLPNPPWYSPEPTGVAYNPTNGHLFVSDDDDELVFEINPGPDGVYDTVDDIITSIDTTLFGSFDPEGITFDTWRGVLFIVDGVNSEVYRISPGANGLFDGVPPDGDDQVTSFDTESIGVTDPEGIAFDSDYGLLYIVGGSDDSVAHITVTGSLLRRIDISAANPWAPSGLAYAPGSLDSSVMSLWITDRGVDNNDDPDENDGKIYEFSIPPLENAPPVVSAGPDQIVVLPDDAVLDGTVFDDGLPVPPAQVVTTWSTSSGPGTVIFANAGAVDTTASFTVPGIYVVRLTANDGDLESSAETTIFVAEAAFTPVADAYVDIREPGTNFGSSQSLEVESLIDGSPQKIAYLRFDVTGINSPVQSAYLKLSVNDPSVFGSSIHFVGNNSWGEHAITFNNQPGYDSLSLDALGPASVDDNVVFDVTQAIAGDGAYSFAILGDEASSGCAGGNDGSIGDSTVKGSNASEPTGETVYFSPFTPSGDGTVTFIHFEEFSADGPIRAGIYDSNGTLLASSAELIGNNSNPGGMEIHAALDQAVCLDSTQSYYLAVWTGDDAWAGTAYGGPGETFYISGVTSFPSSLSLPGSVRSSWTAIRITANNSPSSFDDDYSEGDEIGYHSSEYLNNPPILVINPGVDGVPVAVDDAFATNEDTTLGGDVLANDILGDPPNTVSEVAGVSNGQLSLNADGNFFYEPNVDFNGTDSFTYTLTDDEGESDSAMVTITVTPVNDGVPVAANDPAAAVTPEDTAVTTVNVLLNDSLVDHAVISAFDAASVNDGAVVHNGDGSFSYAPAANFNGSDSFIYTLTDDEGESDSATVTITVTPVNDGVPVAANDPAAAVTPEDTAVTTVNVLLNDTLFDHAVISYFDAASVNGGTVVHNGDGTFNYTPAPGFNGSDSFTYTLTDDEGETSTATVTITVTVPNNSTPVAVDDAFTTNEDTLLDGNVLSNDTLGDAPNTVSEVTGVSSGQLSLNADGNFTYVPDTGFNGTDSFTYRLTDADNENSDAEVIITVIPSGDLTTIEVRVAAALDDAEESVSGRVSLYSSDLELVYDGSEQTVGMRFTGVDIPWGAAIINAYIQFQVDETGSQATSLTIRGETAADAQPFGYSNGNISNRATTLAAVVWSPVAWTTVGAAGADQRTSDISSIVQEIVDQPGWSGGNSLAVIISGTGKRVAESYNGDQEGAPLLHVEYSTGSEVNRAPSVDAGTDQTITLPADTVSLDGTVSDDGLPDPPGAVTISWSQKSGPGTVIFGDETAVDTTAKFPGAGTYVLMLEADDGQLTTSAEVTIFVNEEGAATTIEVRVAAALDDAEESVSGRVSLYSSDLELVYDGSEQTVGMRFTGVDIPWGAAIINAYIQFQVDETGSQATSLTIRGETAADAQPFGYSNGNISNRATTLAAVVWSPVAWTTVGAAGADQRTPDISSIIQEIVDQPGWSGGNSLAVIITGTGKRVAESYNGDQEGAPLLHVEYTP